MSDTLPEDTIATLNAIANILLRCFVITVGAMLFTWLVFSYSVMSSSPSTAS